MRYVRLLAALAAALFLLPPVRSVACGYNFVGDCSSGIHLRINNTPDSFAIADCPSGIRFDGLDVGTIQSLVIARGRAITWESCQNNVTAMHLYYRVFQTGQPGGPWSKFDLTEEYNTLVGPYTTRYFGKSANIDLTTGLTVGADYLLEVYYEAQVDTIGDDFIPETTLIQNNNGHNYQLHFKYGGNNAPPFTVVKTLLTPVHCHGESNGIAGVSVYGNLAGVTYHWSNAPLNNFWAEYNLAAGAYTVTVTNSGGYSQVQTFQVLQPDLLSVQFPDITPVGCNGAAGGATALADGGTGPYQYQWDNGHTTAATQFNTSGLHALIVTDTNGCKGTFQVNIPGQGPVSKQESVVLCAGQSIIRGGMTLSVPGTYTIHLTGINACDTLLTLTLQQLDPGAALAGLPDHSQVTCAVPSLQLCTKPAPNTIVQWFENNIPVLNDSCLLLNFGGVYKIQATSILGSVSCLATKTITVEEHQTPPLVFDSAAVNANCTGLPFTHVVFYSRVNAPNLTYKWVLDGQIISTADTCVIDTVTNDIHNRLTLYVYDQWGCSNHASPLVYITLPIIPTVNVKTTPASAPDKSDGTAIAILSVYSPPYSVLWSNGATTEMISGLSPGLYCVTVTDVNQCATTFCGEVQVSDQTNAPIGGQLGIRPNILTQGQSIEIQLPDAQAGHDLTICFLQVDGRIVSEQHATATSGTIRLALPEQVPSGFVMVRLSGNGFRMSGAIYIY